jgi:hypothetical protein
MRIQGPVFILGFSAFLGCVVSCTSQNTQPQGFPVTIFYDRPFQINCADRPSPLPPSTHGYVTFSPRTPYARTRLDTLDLPRYEVPTLTIAAEPINWIQIEGAKQDHWTIQYCAIGEGNTAEEATGYLQKISTHRTGDLLTLDNTNARGLTGGQGRLLVDAPAGAPVTVHSDAAVEVHDMTGAVRIWAQGRATILNTSGRVDVSAMAVDFAGAQGRVSLDSPGEINIKLTAQQFRGNLSANAEREVRMYSPPGFQTPVEVLVNHPKDFVCRADFCSKMKKDRVNYLFRFSYGDVANASERIDVRSRNAQVTFDTAQ